MYTVFERLCIISYIFVPIGWTGFCSPPPADSRGYSFSRPSGESQPNPTDQSNQPKHPNQNNQQQLACTEQRRFWRASFLSTSGSGWATRFRLGGTCVNLLRKPYMPQFRDYEVHLGLNTTEEELAKDLVVVMTTGFSPKSSVFRPCQSQAQINKCMRITVPEMSPNSYIMRTTPKQHQTFPHNTI